MRHGIQGMRAATGNTLCASCMPTKAVHVQQGRPRGMLPQHGLPVHEDRLAQQGTAGGVAQWAMGDARRRTGEVTQEE